MFVIEDEIHAEWCGQFDSFEEALAELETRSRIPWDSEPNRCPCMSWKTCERKYYIVEYDVSQEPWRNISYTPVLTISSKGVVWEKGFRTHALDTPSVGGKEMDIALSLHYAARRYCINRHLYWCNKYQRLYDEGKARVGSGYSDEALNTFPRYNVLSAILVEVERFDADHLPGYSELSELISLAGQIAQSIFTERPTSEIEAAAMQEERDKFVEAIQGFSPEEITFCPPLPYRRVLAAPEVAALRNRVKDRWGGNGSELYPLADLTDLSLRAFNESEFHMEFPSQRLQSILHSWGIERIYELREYGEKNYVMSIDWWQPYYDGAEGLWFSDTLDWIMYASHERSITLGGTLAASVLSEWKDADRHEWSQQIDG